MVSKISRSVIYLVIIGLITSCQWTGISNLGGSKDIKQPTSPTPASGKAVMVGRVVSVTDSTPFANIPVRLAQIYRQGEEGAFVLDFARSPSSLTDEDGYFAIIDFQPAEYLIVVGKIEDNNYVIYQTNPSDPNTYNIEPDQLLDMGTLKVNYIP